MKKRLLACLLILSLVLAGFVPTASAAEDGIVAQWTEKDELSTAGQEVALQPEKGLLSDAEDEPLAVESAKFSDSDVVTVIVELEDEPLLDVSAGDIAAFAASTRGQTMEQDIRRSQAEIKAQIQAISGVVSTQSVNGASDLEYTYTTVLNGFSMKMPYGDIPEARQIPGVKRIFVAEQYGLPTTFTEEEYTISMSSSTGMVGADKANTLGYDGTGTIVAILDTGFDADHEAFSVMPTEGKYSKSDIAALLDGSLACGVTNVDDVYINEKTPFGYDYGDGDTNAEAVGESHGVHVAGTVAGNNGEDFFGVAPNAQLMIMKIFSDNSGSVSDDIILAGLDDAVKLGADAINMSLGSPAGFTEYGDEDEEETDGYLTYYGVYTRAEAAGVSLMVAAGNETASTNYNPAGNNLTLAQYPDSGIVGSPSTLPAAMSVASVDNAGYFRNHFALGDETIAYNDAVDYASQAQTNILETLEGQTVEYVPISGLGAEEDFAGLDLTGKVALVARGDLNFDVKAANAAAVGAIAIIIYNNTDEGLYYASLQTHTIPVITITKADAQTMLDAPEKSITFSASYYGKADNPNGYQISSFSSIGPAPDLSIKPEITAPGGEIYSSVIGGGYASMGGTSMATPHVAGEAAVLRQYLQETYPDLTACQLGQLANSLLMSTAVPALDNATGTYFAVRRQGAGVANVYNAIVSQAYLSVEDCNRPKAEVGSNAAGNYSYTVTVHNLSDASKTYSLDTAVLVETVVEENGLSYAASAQKRLSGSEVNVTYSNGSRITVPANGTSTFTVNVALTAAGRDYITENFPNGTYVEGFTFLNAEAEDGVNLSLPFLGFCGDWDSLTVFDGDPGEDQNMLGTALVDMDNSGYGYFLGVNTDTGEYNEAKLAYAPQRSNRQLSARVSLLRNVTSFAQTITDEAGNVVYTTGDLGMARKTYAALGMTGIQYTAILWTPGWNGRLMVDGENNVGDWAPDNQWYTFSIEATPVGVDEPQVKSFKFYLDNTRPVIEDVQLYEENGNVYLTGLASDDFYLRRLRVIDSTQEFWYRTTGDAFDAITEPGAESRFTFDVSALAQELAADGKNPGRVGLLLEDSAYNETLVFVDIGPQSITLESVSVSVGESKQVPVSIKPERLTDSALTWAVEDTSVATVDGQGVVTGVSDGTTMVTATAVSGLSAYAVVTVGKGEPVYLSYGEAPELNDRFQTDDGFSWKVIGPDTVQLVAKRASAYGTSYGDMSGDIVIPSTVEYSGKTFRVTSIGANAFYMNMAITSVTIPEGVTDVGYSAFFLCNQLAKISLPDSLEYVDTYAFNTFIATEFDKVPAGLVWIGNESFCKAQITALDLPDSVEYIGEKAFMGSTVETASIPESVTEFGAHIFYNCPNLSYVELPSNLKEIPEGMFWSCTSLKRISLPNGLEKIGNAAFYGSGLERITIPESVKEIDAWAFAWLTNMKTIDIPDNVETIGFSAYIYCQGVETVNIGSGVTTIGKDGFRTWNLTLGEEPVMNVKTEATAAALRRSGYGQEILLNGVPYTGYNGVSFNDGTFSYMPTSDTEVQVVGFNSSAPAGEYTLPAEVYCEGDDRTYTVTSVNERVFFQNQNIHKLNLPDTIEEVGERAFDQMFNVTEFNVPKNLKTVGYQGMGYLGWDAKSIGLEVNTDAVLEIPGTLEVWEDCGFAGNLQKTVVVGEGVTYIGDYGLASMSNMTSITLPSTLEKIGPAAFQSCSSLTAIDLPDSLTYIGDGAFRGVPLESIDLPEGLTYIGRQALGAYVYNADYTAQYWAGPAYVELNGALERLGYDAFRPDAEIVALLNSQRNMVVQFGDMEKLPTVVWDGKTDIPFNDGSYVPAGEELHLTQNVTIDGKLTVDGKVYVPYNVHLEITDDALIVNPENIIYEGCKHENTTTITQPATCTEDGLVTVVCDDCGTVLSEEVIPANCPSQAFTDLDTTRWYHEYTDYVIGNGLMNGVGNNRFAPNNNTTRGQLVTVLYRLAGSPAVEEAATFTDVAGDIWYSAAIAWAEDMGIAQGVTETRFAPGNTVTREQAATFLYRFVTGYLAVEPVDGADLSVYTDAGNISGYAEEAIAWATAEGLFEGFPDGRLLPQGTLTRAQMAKLLAILDQKF